MSKYLLIFGRVTLTALSVLSIKILTSILDARSLGIYSILMGLITLVSFVSSSLSLYYNRHFYEWHIAKTIKISTFKYITSLSSIAFVAIALLCLSLGVFTSIESSIEISSLIISINVCAFSVFNSLLQSQLQGMLVIGKKINYIVISNLSYALNLVLSFLMVFFLSKYSGAGILWIQGQTIGMIIFSILGVYLNIRASRGSSDAKQFNVKSIPSVDSAFSFTTLFKYSSPLLVVSIIFWALRESFKAILYNGWGLDRIGIFSATFFFGAMLLMPIDAIVRDSLSENYFKVILRKSTGKITQSWLRYCHVYHYYLIFTMGLALVNLDSLMLILAPVFKNYSHIVVLGLLFQYSLLNSTLYIHLFNSARLTNKLILPTLFPILLSSLSIFIFRNFLSYYSLAFLLIATSVLINALLHLVAFFSFLRKVGTAKYFRLSVMHIKLIAIMSFSFFAIQCLPVYGLSKNILEVLTSLVLIYVNRSRLSSLLYA